MIDLSKIDNKTPLTPEEGYELTQFYVNYFWRINKFYSLKNQYEEEDVVNELYIKFLKHNHFAKYNCETTSKKYHMMNAVRTSMIDLLRKYRETISLDSENEEGSTLMETVEGKQDVERDVISECRRQQILDQLPDTSRSKIEGYSPLMGKIVNISYRVLALHLEAGYTATELAEFYKNPSTGESVSSGSVSKYIKELREYILDNIVIA